MSSGSPEMGILVPWVFFTIYTLQQRISSGLCFRIYNVREVAQHLLRNGASAPTVWYAISEGF